MSLTSRLVTTLPVVGPKVRRLINEIVALRADVNNLREAAASVTERQTTVPESIDRLSTQLDLDIDKSPKLMLMNDRDLQCHVAALRGHLATDTSEAVKIQLKSPDALAALGHAWFQRMAIPGTHCFTTSDHGRLEISDPGYLNTLGNALLPEEGCILRPMPKWAYLKPVLPDLAGKTVLEIGCNNGFFCFEFEQLGAAKVTGAEVHEGFFKSTLWMATARASKNIEFLLTDALLDLQLATHDVVFMSEVYTHFVDPLFGILRAVNLAKETLIIDNAALTKSNYEIDLGVGRDPATGKMTYHAWILSDGLMLAYLQLCGVPPERVTRYFAPWRSHIVYVIDTRDIANYRKANDFQPCNTSFINMRWRT